MEIVIGKMHGFSVKTTYLNNIKLRQKLGQTSGFGESEANQPRLLSFTDGKFLTATLADGSIKVLEHQTRNE